MTRLASLFIILTTIAAQTNAAHPAPEINLRKTVIVEVVRKTKDAVVNISATKIVRRVVADTFWDPFDERTVDVKSESLGSGFIIHPDGYVVTNNHVIDRARKVTVELSDGRKIPADLVSADSDADLAILKISSDRPLPTLELGDSSDLMIGEPVIAVGNPFGYSQTVSNGIISAIRRDLKDEQGKIIMRDLVQTDAAINPGNSGGPLLNAYGQVIAINTAIRGDAQNIGFAIQVNKLRDLIPELMDPAQVRKLDIPIRLTERRTLTPPAHILAEVFTAGATAQRVRSINGQRPANIIDAYALLLRTKADDKTVSVEFADGRRQRVAVHPAVPAAVAESHRILGVSIEPVTPMGAEKYRLSSDDGLYVSEVTPESPADRAGVKKGDVIIQLGRYRVTSLRDFSTVLKYLPEKGRVRITLIRGDQLMSGALEL